MFRSLFLKLYTNGIFEEKLFKVLKRFILAMEIFVWNNRRSYSIILTILEFEVLKIVKKIQRTKNDCIICKWPNMFVVAKHVYSLKIC
jgi:hypothetical protein